MHEHCTTKMCKGISMKFLCIISGCPAGARKWHISNFAMLLHSKYLPGVEWTPGNFHNQSWEMQPRIRATVRSRPRICMMVYRSGLSVFPVTACRRKVETSATVPGKAAGFAL